MHKYIGGISALSPGWREIKFAPQPGGTVTSAKVSHLSPYGLIACEWEIKGDKLHVTVDVPPNCTGVVSLPGGEGEEKIGSGKREYEVPYRKDESWPPKGIQHPFAPPKDDEPAL